MRIAAAGFAFAPEDVDISAIASGGAVEQWSSEAVKQWSSGGESEMILRWMLEGSGG